ncbi:MAG TPA: choice-of-anchor Q domain-containing protein, partial [Rhodanobacteraceae bacterium]|nr:choice-of-anchor Q domain-containing protein [Rhodanobacteraceae bacterium]
MRREDAASPGNRPALFMLVALLACLPAPPLAAATFAVNSPADLADVNKGDGLCETAAGPGNCTLRAALDETNALAGADTINLQPNVTYTLTMGDSSGAALAITDSVTINGSNNTIDAMGLGAGVLAVTRCIRDAAVSNFCTYGSPVVAISGVSFLHGKALQQGSGQGGGVQNAATLTLSHCVVSSNKAGEVGGNFGAGGGISNGGTLTLVDSVVANNNATGNTHGYGGGIWNSGTLTITNSVVSGNSTNGPTTLGGGILSIAGTLTIDSSAIRDNHDYGTTGEGGGLVVSGGSATIRNSTLSGNVSYRGGGISAGGGVGSVNLALINSTVSGNFSYENGGGLYVRQGVALYNTTITNNLANADDSGSAIGGGIYIVSGNSLTLTNSIVQGNLRSITSGQFATLAGDECAGSLTSLGDNLLSVDVDTSHCTVAGSYGTGAANFGPLDDNGGLTQTHALLGGSAAIDA